MKSAAKLGTRVVAGATIALGLLFVTASATTRASGAARVSAFTSSGAPALAGDGGPANQAMLASPAGVAVDAAGDVAIADTGNCRVRFVPATDAEKFGNAMHRGRIYTIAGTTCGSGGDGGPAERARLSFPADVAFDAGGDVFVADTGNNEVRIISPAGKISNAAGTGSPGFSGDRGLSTVAALDGPSGIAVDPAGDLYIADTNNCRVREVPTRRGINSIAPIAGDIYTVAGNGTCGYAGDRHDATRAELRTPADVAVDLRGDIVIADTGNRRVREVAAAAGTNFGVAMTAGCIYTIAGSGTYNPYFGDGLTAVGDASSLSYPDRRRRECGRRPVRRRHLRTGRARDPGDRRNVVRHRHQTGHVVHARRGRTGRVGERRRNRGRPARVPVTCRGRRRRRRVRRRHRQQQCGAPRGAASADGPRSAAGRRGAARHRHRSHRRHRHHRRCSA